MSRSPASDMCSVRGIGVADIESASTSIRSCRSSSFCRTPKRCSSSTTISPSCFGITSRESTRCVPISTSILPSANSRSACLTSAGLAHARDGLDAHREVAEAVAERLQVLLHEQRRRRQHEHLPTRDRDQERRAHRDLGLAEADVAADQPVHRLLAREILQHLVDRAALILGLGVGERPLEPLEPALLVLVRRPRAGLAHGVQAQQLARELVHGRPCARAQRVPGLAAELRERGRAAVGADVARELGQLVVRDEQPVLALELEVDVVARDAADGLRVEAEEAPDAVLDVHHVVAGPQVGRTRERAAEAPGDRCARGAAPEQLLRRDDGKPRRRPDDAAAQRRDGEDDAGLVRAAGCPGSSSVASTRRRAELRALGVAAVRERDDHAQARAHQAEQLGLGLADAAAGQRGPLRLERASPVRAGRAR